MKLFNKDVSLHSRVNLIKGILGVLVVIILFGGILYWFNPYERARLSRDKERIEKLNTLKEAIDIYLANNDKTKAETCDGCTLGEDIFATGEIALEGILKAKVSTSSAVNITGWVPIDFSLNAKIGETPIKILPQDPLNLPPYVFTYTPGKNGTYKLSAALESTQNNGLEVDDGGINDDRFEVGNDLLLPP